MSQGIPSSPQMLNIPLSMEETEEMQNTTQQTPSSKSNSLKRFFKLKHKSHGSDQTASGGKSSDRKKDGGQEAKKTVADEPTHLPLPSDSVSKDVENANEKTNEEVDNTSRQTLKSSMSNYWNTVLKRIGKKRPPQPNNSETQMDEEIDNEEETNETIIHEELHTLPISEDAVEVAE